MKREKKWGQEEKQSKGGKKKTKQKGNWIDIGSRTERWRKKKPGQGQRGKREGWGPGQCDINREQDTRLQRERSKEAERMTERKRVEAGSSSDSWRKEKYCWGAAQGDGERQKDREQGRETEKENK